MSLMYAQMGLSVVSAIGQYGAQQHQYNMQKISRDYQEAMSGISFAMQSNTLTHNEVGARDALIRAGASIQAQSMKDRATARTEAAAAGVAGGSVTNTIRGLQRSRLLAGKALQERQAAQARANTNNRRQAAFARAMNKDISPLQPPSIASSLLGLGASLIDVYDSHQAPGDTLQDSLSRLGG